MPKENDSEKTSQIELLDDLMELEKEKSVSTTEEAEEQKSPKKKKNKKKTTFKEKIAKLKKWWQNLPKKKKVIIIIITILIIIGIGVGTYFLIKHFTEKEIIEEPAVEDVIVELENYRYENGTLYFLDENSEEIGSYECDNKDENLCFVSYYTNEEDFDSVKKQYEDGTPIKERTPIVNNTYVFINDNKKEDDTTIKLYNIKDKKVMDDTYQLIKKANMGASFIAKDTSSNYGVITVLNDVEITVPFSYNYLGFYDKESSYYVSKQNNRNVIIDYTGKNASKTIRGTIKGFNKKYVKTVDESGQYAVYDYNGKEIFTGYDYVELYDDYAALVSNKKLTLQFYDESKVYEEAINLLNTDYVKTNIYDEENKLAETLESFNIEENENTINVNVINNGSNRTTTINKLEALSSKNIPYINYFDGKLYIYRDVEKQNLLGTYNCANKNDIKSEKDGLTNCTIASDTVFEDNEKETPGESGLIPIFNERYVFINDTPALVNETNKTVVLYDLKANKAISKYNSVNTYSYTGLKEVSFATVTDLLVSAKNKSNKFGVVKIGLNNVSAHIPFSYNALERIGDYYSAQSDNGYILIAKDSGGSIEFKPVPDKIKNYNEEYVTTVTNNLYSVYSYKGEKINKTDYKYIALYPKFYAAVNNENKLGLYLYSKPEENILDEEIPLNLDKYYGEGTLAFRISTKDLSYSVEVGTAANTYELKTSDTIVIEDEKGEENQNVTVSGEEE